MQPVQITAIAIGNWNPKIFSPIWLKERLLNSDNDGQIEVLLDFNDMDFALKFKNLVISPKRGSLELQTQSFEKKDLELFTSTLIGIFDLLPQTPIKAIGINIIYKLDDQANKKCLNILNKASHFEGFEITMLRQTRKYAKCLLNIVIEKKEVAATSVVFNFHYAKTIDFEKGFLENHISETKKLIENGF